MAAQTAQYMISRVLRAAGVIGQGQTASTEDAQQALDLLNDMLTEWQTNRWLVYRLAEYGLVSTGAVSYTVGPGGQYDTLLNERPAMLEYAFIRQLQSAGNLPVDYPLKVLLAHEDYARITVKTLSAFSWGIFYDPVYPLGLLYPYPVPNAALYSVFIGIKQVLQEIPLLSTSLAFPRAYYSAIYWNLAQRTRPNYGLPDLPRIDKLASAALRNLRKANAQIPMLTLPSRLARPGIYNVLSDQNY